MRLCRAKRTRHGMASKVYGQGHYDYHRMIDNAKQDEPLFIS
jgi:hypothetical protein